jgi:hypothetical protein
MHALHLMSFKRRNFIFAEEISERRSSKNFHFTGFVLLFKPVEKIGLRQKKLLACFFNEEISFNSRRG